MTKKKIVFFLVVGGIFLFIISRFIPSKQLRALENEAAKIQLTTAHETRRSIGDRGETSGKPDYPDVFRVYEPNSSYSKQDVYAEIVTILEKNKWVKSNNIVPNFFPATLMKGDMRLNVSVAISSDKNMVTVHFANYD